MGHREKAGRMDVRDLTNGSSSTSASAQAASMFNRLLMMAMPMGVMAELLTTGTGKRDEMRREWQWCS